MGKEKAPDMAIEDPTIPEGESSFNIPLGTEK